MAVHMGHVGVASSLGLATSKSPGRSGLGCGQVWMSVRPAMRSILYCSRSSSITFAPKLCIIRIENSAACEGAAYLSLDVMPC